MSLIFFFNQTFFQVFRWLKKKVEAKAGVSVATVFGFTNNVIKLNMLCGLIILFAVIVPTAVWKDDFDLIAINNTMSSDNLCANQFKPDNMTYETEPDNKNDVKTPDQLWGWIADDYNNSSGESKEICNNTTVFQCAAAIWSPRNEKVGLLAL